MARLKAELRRLHREGTWETRQARRDASLRRMTAEGPASGRR